MTFANEYDDGRKEKVYDVTVPSCGEWRVKPTAPAIDEAKIARRKSKVEANRKKRSKELSQL